MALNTIRIWIEIVKKRFSFFFQRSYLVTHELARKIIERLCGCKFIRSQEIQLIQQHYWTLLWFCFDNIIINFNLSKSF